jgi:hypothetical protein
VCHELEERYWSVCHESLKNSHCQPQASADCGLRSDSSAVYALTAEHVVVSSHFLYHV